MKNTKQHAGIMASIEMTSQRPVKEGKIRKQQWAKGEAELSCGHKKASATLWGDVKLR